jgi:hypothetical protein
MNNTYLLTLVSGILIIGGNTFAQSSGEEKLISAFNNPIIKEKFTADPAAIVHNDSVYLYAGHDVAPDNVNSYRMNEWLVYSFIRYGQLERASGTTKPFRF